MTYEEWTAALKEGAQEVLDGANALLDLTAEMAPGKQRYLLEEFANNLIACCSEYLSMCDHIEPTKTGEV